MKIALINENSQAAKNGAPVVRKGSALALPLGLNWKH